MGFPTGDNVEDEEMREDPEGDECPSGKGLFNWRENSSNTLSLCMLEISVFRASDGS